MPRNGRICQFGIYEWEEGLLIERAYARPHEIVTVPVSTYSRYLGLMDTEFVEPTQPVDLKVPVILAEITGYSGEDYGPMLADGWHRILKAEGVRALYVPGIYLDRDESLYCRMDNALSNKDFKRRRELRREWAVSIDPAVPGA